MRKSFLGPKPEHPELDRLLAATRAIPVTDEQLQEQRISFAYGNAPPDVDLITKASVRRAARNNRIGG